MTFNLFCEFIVHKWKYISKKINRPKFKFQYIINSERNRRYKLILWLWYGWENIRYKGLNVI